MFLIYGKCCQGRHGLSVSSGRRVILASHVTQLVKKKFAGQLVQTIRWLTGHIFFLKAEPHFNIPRPIPIPISIHSGVFPVIFHNSSAGLAIKSARIDADGRSDHMVGWGLGIGLVNGFPQFIPIHCQKGFGDTLPLIVNLSLWAVTLLN